MKRGIILLTLICLSVGAFYSYNKPTPAENKELTQTETPVKDQTESRLPSSTPLVESTEKSTDESTHQPTHRSTPELSVEKPVETPEQVTQVNELSPPENTVQEISPLGPSTLHKKIWIWLGAGLSLQTFNHKFSNGVNSKYDSLEAPSYSLKSGFEIEGYGLNFQYAVKPGKVGQPENATIDSEEYRWSSLRMDGFFPLLTYRLSFGVNQQRTPFLYPEQINSQIYLRNVLINNLALGISRDFKVSDQSRIELSGFYFHPISSDTLDRSTLKITPDLNANISFGYITQLTKYLHIGVVGESEIQSFKFEYRDRPESTLSLGQQSLQLHSLELRMGWEF